MYISPSMNTFKENCVYFLLKSNIIDFFIALRNIALQSITLRNSNIAVTQSYALNSQSCAKKTNLIFTHSLYHNTACFFCGVLSEPENERFHCNDKSTDRVYLQIHFL
jgi:hypothetical protein